MRLQESIATTYSDRKGKPITWKDIERVAATVQKMGKPQLPDHKPRIFERIMNQLGWHRQYQIAIIESSSLGLLPMTPNQLLEEQD